MCKHIFFSYNIWCVELSRKTTDILEIEKYDRKRVPENCIKASEALLSAADTHPRDGDLIHARI